MRLRDGNGKNIQELAHREMVDGQMVCLELEKERSSAMMGPRTVRPLDSIYCKCNTDPQTMATYTVMAANPTQHPFNPIAK